MVGGRSFSQPLDTIRGFLKDGMPFARLSEVGAQFVSKIRTLTPTSLLSLHANDICAQ
jgi:hypothetical protein